MVFKTLVAATCAAALAGSMVYFSTSPDGAGGSVKLDSSVTEQVQVKSTAKKNPSIIDRYINPNDGEQVDTTADNPYKPAKVNAFEKVVSAQEPTENAKPAKTKRKIRSRIKAQQPAQAKTVDVVDPAQMRIDVVFKQAEMIAQPDLRDRAYLDLADYATNKGMFDQAKKAALRIKQIELRDTARSRIAMGMARYGMADEAFALIGKVEVKELRDVMRLQVIEALLGTDTRR